MRNYSELLNYLDVLGRTVTEPAKDSILITYLSYKEKDATSMTNLEVDGLIRHTCHLESVNSEIRQRVNFDNGQFRKSYLATKLTHDITKRTVFSKCVENKYFEKVVSCDRDNSGVINLNYESHCQILDDSYSKINAISKIINIDWKSSAMVNWCQSVLHILNLNNFSRITDVELDLVQQLIVEIYTNHYVVYDAFLNSISNLNDLSSTLHSGIIIKLCCKLSPLIGVKLLQYLDSDDKIRSFFLNKKTELFWRYKLNALPYEYAVNIKTYVIQHRKFIVPTALVTLGSFPYIYSKMVVSKKGSTSLITGPVQEFSIVMDAIKANASLITFKIFDTFGSVIDSAYRGFRNTLLESAINLLLELKLRLLTEGNLKNSKTWWFWKK